jgi:hypothetical protein
MKRNFTILSVFLIIMSIANSCVRDDEIIRGQGRSIEVFADIDISRVLEIETLGSIDIEIIPSNHYEVFVTAQENILDFVSIRVNGNVARVGYRNGAHVVPTDIVKVKFFIPVVNAIISNGSGYVYCYDGFRSYNDLYIKNSGSGDIFISELSYRVLDVITTGSGNINIENADASEVYSSIRGSGGISINGFSTSRVNTFIGGSGRVRYRGITHTHTISIEGSGLVDSYSLNTENIKIDVKGSGNSYVWANRYLDANIRGSGDIYYKGNPHITVTGNGSGRLIRM